MPRKRACGEIEANNNRRITGRRSGTVSLPQAFASGCYGAAKY